MISNTAPLRPPELDFSILEHERQQEYPLNYRHYRDGASNWEQRYKDAPDSDQLNSLSPVPKAFAQLGWRNHKLRLRKQLTHIVDYVDTMLQNDGDTPFSMLPESVTSSLACFLAGQIDSMNELLKHGPARCSPYWCWVYDLWHDMHNAPTTTITWTQRHSEYDYIEDDPNAWM